METKTALAAAAALALTVTGGVSALFLTVDQANAGSETPATIVEYVDQNGAPLRVAPVAPATGSMDQAEADPYTEAEEYEDHDEYEADDHDEYEEYDDHEEYEDHDDA